jgi:hypothetical protein
MDEDLYGLEGLQLNISAVRDFTTFFRISWHQLPIHLRVANVGTTAVTLKFLKHSRGHPTVNISRLQLVLSIIVQFSYSARRFWMGV